MYMVLQQMYCVERSFTFFNRIFASFRIIMCYIIYNYREEISYFGSLRLSKLNNVV